MNKKTILIVDDTYENLYLLRVILEEAGFIVIEANDGSEGLKILNENSNVDLIISDILMPIMDGYLFCQECKKVESLSEIPFVFYTSTYTDKLDEDFGLKLGASSFLRKPIEHDELLRTVGAIFDANKSQVKAVKPVKKTRISEGEVLKLYSERLINKLEQKSLDLGNEVVERKKIEQLLIYKNEILDLIAINTPLNNIFDRLLLNYEAIHPNYFGAISLLDEDGVHLNLESAPSMPKPYILAIKRIAIGENVGSCGTAAFTKKPVIVSDISTDKLWKDHRDVALKHHFYSCWSLPILSENNVVLGTFAIYSKSISTPSLDEISELNFAVSMAHIAIEKFRKVAEIKKKDESYKSLIDQASDSIMTYSIDGTIHEFNKASYLNLGYTEKEFLKMKIQDFNVGDLIQDKEKYKKLVKGEAIIFARKFKRKDQSLIDVEISAKLQKDGKFLGIARDVTERLQAQLRLRAAKEFTDKLIMSMQEGLLIASAQDTRIIMINESLCKITGYSEEELIGHPHPFPFWQKEDHDSVLKKYSEVAQGDSTEVYYDIIKKNGEIISASFFTGSIENDKNETIALYATVKDVSEELKAKRILEDNAKKSLERKNVIIELASLLGTDYKKALNKITALTSKTVDVDRVSVLKFNTDKTEMSCKNLYTRKSNSYESGLVFNKKGNELFFNTIIQNKIINASDALKNKITNGFVKDYLKPLNVKSKLSIPIQGVNEVYGVLCIEAVGNARDWSTDEEEFGTTIANLVSLLIESSERKLAESELKSEKEFSEKLITSLHDGLSVIDLEGLHIKVNSALCKMTGFTEEELVGIKAPFPYWPPEEYDEIYKAFNNPSKNIGFDKKAIFMKKNGQRFPVTLASSVIKNKDGEVMAYFTTITDITLRVKAENILKESVKISDERKNIIIELANLIGEDFNSSLKKITKTSAKAINAELVTIWEYKNDKTELLSKLYYNSIDSKCDVDSLIIRKKDFPNYFDAFKDQNSLNITDVFNNPITKAFAEQYYISNKISSRIDVLIYGRNDYYGIISFESTTPNKVFTNEEVSFATSIASIVSLMVESKKRTLAESNTEKSNELLMIANKELIELRNQLEQENVYLRNEIDLVFNYEEMVYGSKEFSSVLTEVEKVAPTNATVLLLGESGTGKELLARAVHNTSLRNKKPLIKVNCSAIPRELIESELFGHKKGSFTGAFSDKIGKFELADGGTLFLDEIGELPLDMQPKILRFLQEGEIEIVGGTSGLKKLDVRVIAATNRNLIEEIEKKQFREDLYFRLNVFPIEVPPLRKRKDDIPLLVEHFVDKFNKAYDKQIKYISDDSMNQLKAYPWPGNIRELENLIERASILSNDETLLIPGFESTTQKANQPINNKDLSLDTAQRNHILQVLEQCNWKISGNKGASAILNLKPSTLRDKMAKLGISKPVKK